PGEGFQRLALLEGGDRRLHPGELSMCHSGICASLTTDEFRETYGLMTVHEVGESERVGEVVRVRTWGHRRSRKVRQCRGPNSEGVPERALGLPGDDPGGRIGRRRVVPTTVRVSDVCQRCEHLILDAPAIDLLE